jgi:hypothetical protein
MNASIEQVFLDALEDMRAGRGEPIERYLELVPQSKRAQLADLLAMYFASRRRPAGPTLRAASYERVLATIDRVSETAGPAGILPGLLRELRRTRGLRRKEVTGSLCQRFGIGEEAAGELAREYHRLETGQLRGEGLSQRLIAALAELFRIDCDDLAAASLPVPGTARPRPARAFGRSTRDARLGQQSSLPTQPEPRQTLVWQLFHGGRDA